MQQDRLIGAAGEGRYSAVRGWAGRPEYGNSLLVREPLAASDEARHRSRAQPGSAPGDGAAGGRVGGHGRRHSPPPPRAGRGPPRRTGCASSSSGSTAAPAADAHVADGRLQCRSRRADVRPDASGRLPLGLCGGERRRSPPSRGRRASRRRRWTPTARRSASTTSGSAAPSRSTSARLAFDRPDPEDPTLYPSRPPRDLGAPGGRPASRDALTPAAGPSRRLAPRTREHDRGVHRRPRDPRLRRPRVRRPHVGGRGAGSDPRRDARARAGRRTYGSTT